MNFLAFAGSNSKYAKLGAEPAGFLAGLWHGLMIPITFLISLSNPGVRVYEVNNNGSWYDLGFLLGIALIFGGGTSAAT